MDIFKDKRNYTQRGTKYINRKGERKQEPTKIMRYGKDNKSGNASAKQIY